MRPHLKRSLALFGGFVAVVLLWDTIAIYPIKVFVVLLHEISHGLAAIATGGSISRIEVNSNQGGVCWTSGGIRFVVASAGYLGSLLFGALIFLAAGWTKIARPLAALVGMFILSMTVVYVRNWFGFGFGLLAGLALLAGAVRLPSTIVSFVLQLLGISSCLYAILDIKSDTISRRGIGSDADTLAEMTWIPGVVWGVLWIVLSVAVTAGVVYLGLFRGLRSSRR